MSFLRAEAAISGTTTTGTGTLTLAACPSPPGGVDFFAAFTGQGLGTSQTIPITYTIMEYTDATFATAKQMEKGVGALTIGANIGATTMARSKPQSTATAMNTTTPTYTTGAPTAITIGTAANTLVFIGASASDLSAWSPYFETAGDNLGALPMTATVGSSGGCVFNTILAGGCDLYVPFEWRVPMLVKRCSVRCAIVGSGGNSNCDARLYEINSSGRPGKLLYDFGLMGTANITFHSTGNVSSGAAGAGYFLQPGEYFLDLCDVETDTVHAQIVSASASLVTINSGRLGASAFLPATLAFATAPVIGAAPDPANVTGYTVLYAAAVGKNYPMFALAPS